MNEPLAYCRGEFVPASQCVLPMHDLGVVLGASVTDFARTFHQSLYRLNDHVVRLHRSAQYACIEPPVSVEESERIAKRLIESNSEFWPDRELGLVFYMTAGENPVYAGAAGTTTGLKPTYIQHTFPLPFEIWRRVFRDGAHCVTPSNRHWPPECVSSKIKNRNRLHMWIGEQEVKRLNAEVTPVFLDVDGNIAETGGSNFVIYREGRVISPRRRNILWGVSLCVLEEILSDLQIPFVEEDIQPYDVATADEAWMPTTPYCLGPVTRFNGRLIGDGKPGPVWRRVLDRWSAIVDKDIYRETAGAD